MNGLTLRINSSSSKKTKNTFSFVIVTIPEKKCVALGLKYKEVQQFLDASNVEQQLSSLKDILNSPHISLEEELMKFLVIVFFQAEVKHPVKCFLTRSITKSKNLQKSFSTVLSEELLRFTTGYHPTYNCYVDVINKIASCLENFPAGAEAVKSIEIPLAEYMQNGLTCIVRTLSEMKSLSPTEKNEVFHLAHTILRLILYIAQKVSPNNVNKLTPMLAEIRVCLKGLLFDEDVPMDTKSICGLVYVYTYILERNVDSWIDVLIPGEHDKILKSFLERNASRLCLYSAVATLVPMNVLQDEVIDNTPAIIILTANVMAVGDRTSSDSTFNLAVTRTLVHISKGLDKVTSTVVGLRLVDVLLPYVWSHLDHCMDSVRHLSAQALSNVVKYCGRLQRGGDRSALDGLFSSLLALDRRRKGFYVSLTALAAELGTARVLDRLPNIVCEVMDQLHVQAVQASATTTLETLLSKQADVPSNVTYKNWVVPIMAHAARQLDSPELAILEGLLTKVIKRDETVMEYILPHVSRDREYEETKRYDLKCTVMALSACRKSGFVDKWAPSAARRWSDVVGRRALEEAAVNSFEQTRILALSLVVESPKSTETFTSEELDFVLYFLKYNVNARAPNFRQLMLSLIKKFLKRFEDSFKVIRRRNDPSVGDQHDYYVKFLENLRAQCYASLIRGANYGRRYVSLQTLAWCEQMSLDGYDRQWKEEYVDKLLLHLEDSYENNKALALDTLKLCPTRWLQIRKYSTSLQLRDILRQASSVKPTDCASAAYKLSLLRDELPENVLEGEQRSMELVAEPVSYTLLRRLLTELQAELDVCRASVVVAARDAPMYGLLHCMVRLVATLPADTISKDETWSSLIAEIVTTCIEVNGSVACVVNNSSPEGHLPMDASGVVVTDHGNSANVRLRDGRPVTSQMVLLCAWRSVKEVSLLLGSMCSRLEISTGAGGSLTCDQVLLVGDHFTSLLAETKHRGAFEQAYIGFTSLLARLWRCRSPALHELPKRWLEELMDAIQNPIGQGKLCATRRSAGLPFMIQALVSTELQVRENPTCFHACMASLLQLARTGEVTTRTHCANVLRALVRCAALRDVVAPHVGAAIRVALAGFEGNTWEERNSSTLLFSALMVRVFGVQRSRREELCVRNRMTGRIFFLRYPELYDLLLGKLEEVSNQSDSQVLRPALYPILLLLARLYPSSLEGTVSNLKLVAFVPHVVACARSADLRARRLAAAAIVPLVSPQLYISHLDTMLQLLCDEHIKRNYCHGILLQVTRLIEKKPDDLNVTEDAELSIKRRIVDSLWVLRQAGDAGGADGASVPCYVIADEYLKMINSLVWKFPTWVDRDTIEQIINSLNSLLFGNNVMDTSGRAVCLANSACLYFIILNLHDVENLCELIYRCLSHKRYEVVLSALNYILLMHQEIEAEDKFQEHMSIVLKKDVLVSLNQPTYYDLLCDIIRTNKYLECNQKALRVLTLSGDTQSHVVQAKERHSDIVDDVVVVEKLMQYIENEHEHLTHVYLHSFSNVLTRELRNIANANTIVRAVRVIFACCLSHNSDATRSVVVDFLDANIELLLVLDLKYLNNEEKFEYKATLYCTLIAMLEDDNAELSQRTSNLISRALRVTEGVVPSRCAQSLTDHIRTDRDAVALFIVLALLDFKSEVVMTDEGNDECRVFDQNERYNINLEETVWTRVCAENIKNICNGKNVNLLQCVFDTIEQSIYKPTMEKLCGNNLIIDTQSQDGDVSVVSNPKIQLFINDLVM